MLDALGDVLAPYTGHIGKFAGGVTTLQFLSGIFLLNDIRKIGRSDAYPPEPFIGGIVLAVLSLKLGAIMNDDAMIKTNVIGVGISAVFLSVFYYYASSEFRRKIWAKIGIATAFSIACLGYSKFETAENVEFRFGLLITGFLVFLVGSPLLSLSQIIEKKSTEGLPFPIILSGTVVAASWAIYGISIKNSVVMCQNLLLLFLSSIQLSLFAIYPSTSSIKVHAASSKSRVQELARSTVDIKKNE